jgi:catechol 2,3-dioxygenase-like lactoylglutathione lyase family enzyme
MRRWKRLLPVIAVRAPFPQDGVFMKQFISAVSLLVPDYDEGLEFYGNVLGCQLIEDTELEPGKRWVLVAPPGSAETRLLLAKADGPEQQAAIGNQAGGRVFLFLTTDDFDRDYAAMSEKGCPFSGGDAATNLMAQWRCFRIRLETNGI